MAKLTQKQKQLNEKRWAQFSAKSKQAQKLSPADAADQKKRMKWWHDARFGMFVHWGLYSLLGRHEWVMNRERIPVKEYEQLADQWQPKKNCMRQWAKLARQAGMKYMVMTTKHHEGFCLWDTKQTDYNAVRRGPGRDLVAEYVAACREYGLKVGFYYSLMDWHHPDGARCAYSEPARKRFVKFTRGCVEELMGNYGNIDILWYDVPWPLQGSGTKGWETDKTNAMARYLQPNLIINDRSWRVEDFTTPEENITPPQPGRAWEACMTFNGSWGYMPSAIDWHSERAVINMLQKVSSGGVSGAMHDQTGYPGNLLLNIGPRPDGSVPEEAIERLTKVGKWTKKHGEAIYGNVQPVGDRFIWAAVGNWTMKKNTAYFWCHRWVGKEITIGGVVTKLKKATLLTTGKPVKFTQTKQQLKLQGLPAKCPDKSVGCAVFKLEFASQPRQILGPGLVEL